jgi:hypothetical protein
MKWTKYNPSNYFNKFSKFDKVTELRLINSFLIAFGMALFAPVLVSLKGIYLAAYIISIFAIAQTLAVKTNNYMVKNVSIRSMFRIGVYIHLAFIFVSGLYFYSPELMIWLDSIIGIIEVAVFSAFSISLNNYITDNYPDSMSEFQIIRNGSWADGYLLGLFIITIVTYLLTVGTAILLFIFFNLLFSIWMITKWNFYNDDEYCISLPKGD